MLQMPGWQLNGGREHCTRSEAASKTSVMPATSLWPGASQTHYKVARYAAAACSAAAGIRALLARARQATARL